MKPIQRAWRVVGEYRRAYIALNLVYYGLVAAAMTYVAFNPSLQQSLLSAVGSAFSEGPLSALVGAYGGGKLILAMVLTFVVNVAVGSFVWITLPSLVIPFSGLLAGTYRAVLWGLVLSPTTREMSTAMIPHSLTLILEGQAYVLAMLAAYIQGRALLWPHSAGAQTHREGYLAGLKRSARLYLLVILLLALAAIYEAVEVILIIPLLGGTR